MTRYARPIAAAILSLALVSVVRAQDAAALMQEGNALARASQYREALQRYRQAAAAGLDSPLLHYNIAVVDFRLGLDREALSEFERAAADPALAPLAYYNLGLTSRALGDEAGAVRWFERVLESAARPDLRALASRALAAGTARATPPREPRTGGLSLAVIARYGEDGNVYRAPSTPYVDLAQTARPLVTPRVQSSPFMPLDALARYRLPNAAGDTDFLFSYRLNGNFYPSAYSNANEVRQRLEIGADVGLPADPGRRRTLDSALYLIDNRETNFNPDDGLNRDIGGVDISQRFSYRGAGIRSGYEQQLDRWTWGIDARFERLRYRRTPPVASYDHNFYFLRASAAYRVSERTSLRVSARSYRRDYDERHARDLGGVLSSANPTLLLQYRGLGLGAERVLSPSLTLGFDYQRLERRDAFVGYEDYTRDIFRLAVDYRPTPSSRLGVRIFTSGYDYARAFAFNNPEAGARDLDRLDALIRFDHRLRGRLWLTGEAEIDDVGSSDTRAEYSRTRVAIGVSWRR